jgi:hypothetical protein
MRASARRACQQRPEGTLGGPEHVYGPPPVWDSHRIAASESRRCPILTTLPVIAAYIYPQKFMVEGLTAGSVKG